MGELNMDFWLENDPKCPACGKFHDRVRVGNSLTFVVKEPCAALDKKKGWPIAIESQYRPRSKKEE